MPTLHAVDYMQRWVLAGLNDHHQLNFVIAMILLAAGCVPSRRLTTSDCALQMLQIINSSNPGTTKATTRLLKRALSFYGPGELRAMRVADPSVIDFVHVELTYAVVVPNAAHDDPPEAGRTTVDPRALDGLSTVACEPFIPDDAALAALIARHASTVTALECSMAWRVTPAMNEALAACSRLEVLECAALYAPTAWLGLVNLHTLRGVDLGAVPASSIAAALPRLRNLSVVLTPSAPPEAVTGFFEDLAPRLSSFCFSGSWPKAGAPEDGEQVVTPLPLPSLAELRWEGGTRDPLLGRAFLGARPVLLHVPSFDRLADAMRYHHRQPRPRDFLSRVRDLTFYLLGHLRAADMEDLLSALPQLRRFSTTYLQNDFLWPLCDSAVIKPRSANPIRHARLLSLTVSAQRVPAGSTVTQLRQVSFPRLRRLVVNGASVELE